MKPKKIKVIACHVSVTLEQWAPAVVPPLPAAAWTVIIATAGLLLPVLAQPPVQKLIP